MKVKKKILVTGVAGFLGCHLAEKFVEIGHDVVGIDNMLSGYKDNIPNKIKFYKYDCCNLEKVNSIMKNVDVVYHCAATAHEGLSVFSPIECKFVKIVCLGLISFKILKTSLKEKCDG